MNANVLRAVLLTAFLCAVTGYILIGRAARRRECTPSCWQVRPPRDMGPGHPDREVSLTIDEGQALAAMEAAFRAGSSGETGAGR